MSNFILKQNATPVYNFLSYILHVRESDYSGNNNKILDCGAGGSKPPLVLFQQHGFECTGIDVSEESLKSARIFCSEKKIPINFIRGDMRNMQFGNEEFDFIYEHYSMCHLTKKDTKKAVSEMKRVLKAGGLAFLGVISADTWPKTGTEVSPGEWAEVENGNSVIHSYFTDEEADNLVSGWEILQKEKRELWNLDYINDMSEKDWEDLFSEINDGTAKEKWQGLYSRRHQLFRYTHLYYILKNPV